MSIQAIRRRHQLRRRIAHRRQRSCGDGSPAMVFTIHLRSLGLPSSKEGLAQIPSAQPAGQRKLTPVNPSGRCKGAPTVRGPVGYESFLARIVGICSTS